MALKQKPGKTADNHLDKYGLFFDNAQDIVLFVRFSDGRILDGNNAASRVYGYSRQELLSLCIKDLRVKESWPSIRKQMEKAAEESILFETHHVKNNGERFAVEVHSKGIEIDGQKVILSIIRDITNRKKAENKLRESEERFRKVFEEGPLGIILLDKKYRFIKVNDAFCQMMGYSEKELLKKTFADVTHPEDLKVSLKQADTAFKEKEETVEFEKRYLRKDGSIIWVHLISSIVKDDKGEVIYALTMFQDITERKKTDQQMAQTTAELKAVMESLPDLYFRVDTEGTVLEYSGDENELFIAKEKVLNNKIHELASPKVGKLLKQAIKNVHERKKLVSVEYWINNKNGKRHYEARLLPLLEDKIMIVVRNITKRKKIDEVIRHQAYHDHLTGLPNRALFYDRLTNTLAYAKRYNVKLSVLFLDLDYFKVINDTFGHVLGDELLKAVATRLKNLLRESETCARLGGDEFMILLPRLSSRNDAEAVAKRIIRSFGQPFSVEGNKIKLNTSIGIALYPEDGAKAEAMIHNADTAMYLAKETGRCCYKFCEDILKSERLALRIRERRLLR